MTPTPSAQAFALRMAAHRVRLDWPRRGRFAAWTRRRDVADDIACYLEALASRMEGAR